MASSLNPAHTDAEFSQCCKDAESSDGFLPTASQLLLEATEQQQQYVQTSNST